MIEWIFINAIKNRDVLCNKLSLSRHLSRRCLTRCHHYIINKR
jgi:hypothetical protein